MARRKVRKEIMEKDTVITRVPPAVGGISPIVVLDQGRASKKSIRQLKEGCGRLVAEVEMAVEQARAQLSDEDRLKPIVPVVLIYKKKRRKSSLPLSPLNPLNLLR
jgi:hypothetical protein